MSKHLTAPVPTKSLPGGIPFIIGNEAAERFSFYGMKGILVVFMTSFLYAMTDDPNGAQMPTTTAMQWYHWFTSAVYITPFLGAVIADIFLGKYLTIMLLSIVYCIGHGVLALMGAQFWGLDQALDPLTFLIIGLVVIAIGSGGIKPCVSAHVGDQFGASNAHWLSQVFSWFYLSINLGAAIASLLTPWLLHWYGPHWAFGIPGVLMALATLVFWLGRNRFIHVPAGGIGFLRELFSWEGISALLKLAIIFIFVAVFWALFDQTGSAWVLQAENMDRTWLGITWLAPQLQFINPVMILILVPLTGFVIYPIINKVFKLTPLRKICIGLFIMVPGFAMVSMVQNWIDAGAMPSIGWQVFAYAILTTSEVMVSITCLEFSYTQAPRKIKSFVMATFLASVTLGNLFTGAVFSFITIDMFDPNQEALVEDGSRSENPDGSYTVSMPWVGFMGGDSVRVTFNAEGVKQGIDVKGLPEVKMGLAKIKQSWEVHGGTDSATSALPSDSDGEALISGISDPWGRPLGYRLISSTEARVSSAGPDGEFLTPDDINDTVEIIPPASSMDKQTWLYNRLKQRDAVLGINPEAETNDSGVPEFTDNVSIGGGQTLEGAAQFWFFTYLMLATAILFIPVSQLYKPKQYLPEEGDHAKAVEEGISA
jgi:POT family proton-dependent oligopeptide transporter